MVSSIIVHGCLVLRYEVHNDLIELFPGGIPAVPVRNFHRQTIALRKLSKHNESKDNSNSNEIK